MDRRLKYTLYGIGIFIGGLVALNFNMWLWFPSQPLEPVIVTNIYYMVIISLGNVYLLRVHKMWLWSPSQPKHK